jgi:hypothetical protein
VSDVHAWLCTEVDPSQLKTSAAPVKQANLSAVQFYAFDVYTGFFLASGDANKITSQHGRGYESLQLPVRAPHLVLLHLDLHHIQCFGQHNCRDYESLLVLDYASLKKIRREERHHLSCILSRHHLFESNSLERKAKQRTLKELSRKQLATGGVCVLQS